jgi:hypothetical protein
MAVPAERVPSFWRHSCSPLKRYGPDLGMALVVIGVGVAGLSANCWLRTVVEPWINIHLLFGALLCGWLMVRIRVRVKQSPCMQPDDIHDMSRQNSRIAYLVLYAVVGIKLSAGIVTSAWNGAQNGFGPLADLFRNGPGSSLSDPTGDYQMCPVSGLIALAFVRVMVFRLRLRASERTIDS